MIARRINSCQTLVAKACSRMAIAIPSEARSSISLRPFRSARLPHIGDTMAETRNVTLNVSPDHMERASCEVTPSCDTYSGRKGKIWLMASPVKKHPNQTEMRLTFQDSIKEIVFIFRQMRRQISKLPTSTPCQRCGLADFGVLSSQSSYL